MAVTNKQVLNAVRRVDANVGALLSYTLGLATQINLQGERMSELDQSVEGLTTEVSNLAGRIADNATKLVEAVEARTAAEAALTEARADDATDDARIAELEAEVEAAKADVDENVTRINEARDEVAGLAKDEPVDPEEPVEPPVEPPTP